MSKINENKSVKFIVDMAQVVIIAFGISWVVRTTLVDSRVVPTGSMLPTIQLQDRLICDKIAYKFTGINRGDIVIFHPPATVDQSGNDWIKRVIGLPGEKIEVHNGTVFINEKALDEPYELQKPNYTFGPYTVPEDSYFVMGDNKNNSNDSHYWGALPKQNIIGRAALRYWPLNHFGKLAK